MKSDFTGIPFAYNSVFDITILGISYVLTWVYLPLNIFAMFLMDTPTSITIPGILSSLVLYHIVFKQVDFTIEIPISCNKKDD
ncbi:MAG: hypothetical protein PHG06_00675 [Parabacteroides sp.]|nr:hypothetical protein [Parabacteroides sp.]